LKKGRDAWINSVDVQFDALQLRQSRICLQRLSFARNMSMCSSNGHVFIANNLL